MAEFALYIGGSFKEIRKYQTRPENIEHKSVAWYPVVREVGSAFDGLQGDVHLIRRPPVISVPASISDRQFFHVLALNGSITQQEALAAVKTGEIPSTIASIIDAIEDDVAKFNATMLLSGAVEFRRDHPLVEQFGAALGYSADAIDELFIAAAQL